MPSTDLRHVYIQVTMASPQRIDAIIIPYDGSIPYVVDFLLVVPGSSHIDINDCLEEEEELGLIPNIWVPDRHYQEFNWELRSIAFIPASDIENHIAEPGITYMMYTSRDEEAGTYRKCSCAKKFPITDLVVRYQDSKRRHERSPEPSYRSRPCFDGSLVDAYSL